MTTLIVIAKETRAGHVKTRLHPPLSLEQAATLAAAALADTLEVALALPATRRVLAFDGTVLPPGLERGAGGFDVVAQPAGTLDLRLAAAFDACTGPTVLIGMDTPQVTPALLAPLFAAWPDDADAVFGAAEDGGFWALGMRDPRGDLIRGVPMSREDTGQRQRQRLEDAGLQVHELPRLNDVDTFADALDVAAVAPGTRFAALTDAYAAELERLRLASL